MTFVISVSDFETVGMESGSGPDQREDERLIAEMAGEIRALLARA